MTEKEEADRILVINRALSVSSTTDTLKPETLSSLFLT